MIDRAQWGGLAELLLTREGTWRKSLTKNQGFPAPSSTNNKDDKTRFTEMKQRMTTLLESLQGEDVFREQLALLRELPPHQYTDDEWETLQALVELLRIAAAHLELVFSEQGQVDFPALVQAAIQALGEPEAPTDLALALDYRIRHLLMDEFQDTSFNQYGLLKRLTAGWQPEDGHTLFVVGDPMQSIYRFRDAEVGCFSLQENTGLVRCCLNFSASRSISARNKGSSTGSINAFRTYCQQMTTLPVVPCPMHRQQPFTPQLTANAVTVYPSLVYPSLKRDDIAEARQVVSIVQQAKTEHPQGTTAILVRGRNHLVQIVEQLQKAKLRFQAVEIERLAHRPVVQDLLALTRALSHIGDRIAWLAVLRAPCCGLTLKDLYTLAGDDSGRSMIDLLHQEQRIEQLSEDGRSRIARVLPVLDTALSEQARCSLRSNVEGVWTALGGPACVTDETDLEDAEVYLQLLERLSNTENVPDIHELNKQVEQLFSLPDVEANDSIQLMTVHKAKGLEFDTVIMPGLGRSPRPDDEKLLHWLERGRESSVQESKFSDLLLAPISAQGEDKNPMAAYLQRLDKVKERFEDGRLLYVAATRAKQRLHLLGHVGLKEKDGGLELKEPPKNSLLARLWPVVENDFQSLLAERGVEIPLPENAIEQVVPHLSANPVGDGLVTANPSGIHSGH